MTMRFVVIWTLTIVKQDITSCKTYIVQHMWLLINLIGCQFSLKHLRSANLIASVQRAYSFSFCKWILQSSKDDVNDCQRVHFSNILVQSLYPFWQLICCMIIRPLSSVASYYSSLCFQRINFFYHLYIFHHLQ